MKKEFLTVAIAIAYGFFTNNQKGTKPEALENEVKKSLKKEVTNWDESNQSEWNWPEVVHGTLQKMVTTNTTSNNTYTGLTTLTKFLTQKDYFNYFHTICEGNVSLGHNSLECAVTTGHIVVIMLDKKQIKLLNTENKFINNVIKKYNTWIQKVVGNEREQYLSPEFTTEVTAKMVTTALLTVTNTIDTLTYTPTGISWEPAIKNMLNTCLTNADHFNVLEKCLKNIHSFGTWIYNNAGTVTINNTEVKTAQYYTLQAYNHGIIPTGGYTKYIKNGLSGLLNFFDEKQEKIYPSVPVTKVDTKLLCFMYNKTKADVETMSGKDVTKNCKLITGKETTKNEVVGNLQHYEQVLVASGVYTQVTT